MLLYFVRVLLLKFRQISEGLIILSVTALKLVQYCNVLNVNDIFKSTKINNLLFMKSRTLYFFPAIASDGCVWMSERRGASIDGYNAAVVTGKSLAACQAACDAHYLCLSIDLRRNGRCSLNYKNTLSAPLSSEPLYSFYEKQCISNFISNLSLF